MLKKLLLIVMAFLVSAGTAFAQSGTITGTVTDQSSGETLPSVNVFIVELQRGAATDVNGEFTIEDVEYGTYTVRASFVGYDTFEQEVTVDQENVTLDIALTSQTQQLDDVVVTAFGLSRDERSLSYSVQEVSGDNLPATGNEDLVSSLGGQVSGVQVIGSPGAAIGGSSKIRIRGESGLSASSPLFVVDGTPISNQNFTSNNRDLGSLSQDLNIDDVESISVLKGAAAAALYGNRASDGVVVITTKGGQVGERPFQVEFSHTTRASEVYKLPDYQNTYAGGYSQSLIPVGENGESLYFDDNGDPYLDYDEDTETYSDPYGGEVQQRLNYAADESWGPKMEGQMYRPWWSFYHGDFTGDGQDDYGTEIPLEPNENNVRNFYETGVEVSNSLAISGGSENSSYRVSVEDVNANGVMPNSGLDKTYLNFNGALDHNNRITSKVRFNYVNTQTKGQPSQSYSPTQGNPTQMFNQWFQRQLDMDKLENYRLEDGTITTWNRRSTTNGAPLYWDSPYFSVYENVPHTNRNRVYGNYSLSYNINDNLQVAGKVHADFFDFSSDDRIASGGLNTDWYTETQRTRREMNYEGSVQYQRDFGDWSFDGFLGTSLRQESYEYVTGETVGGLAVPNLYNLEASSDRPDVSNYSEEKEVRSVFGTANVGWNDLVYIDMTLRNDWSSSLPEANNSYLYYGLSGSLVFTEFDFFENQDILTYGKVRASHAQVGDDLDPYQIYDRYFLRSPRGSYSAMTVPDLLNNPDLEAAIATDTEFGLDLRFLDGRLRLDGTYYRSISEDEILELDVSPTSGYDQSLINAGEFETTGLEFALGGTPLQTQNWTLDLNVNWSTILSNQVNELAPQLDTRVLEPTSFYAVLLAEEGEEWGQIRSYSYARADNGKPIINPATGSYAGGGLKKHGSIIPDWNGGVRANLSYKNVSLSAYVDYQKGGQFYSISKMFNNYSGIGAATVGSNTLGNPMRDPIVDSDGSTTYINDDGDEVSYVAIPLEDASDQSGGILVEGVDEEGNPVQYLSAPGTHFYQEFLNQEAYIYDASYIKLRSVKISYTLPNSMMDRVPISGATISVNATNPLLIYSSVDDLDPSIIQGVGENSFGWWEGGTVPGTRSVGASVNLRF